MIKRFITTTKIDKNRGINNNILLYYAQKTQIHYTRQEQTLLIRSFICIFEVDLENTLQSLRMLTLGLSKKY